MSEKAGMELDLLLTGVPGLDSVLGGGLPEYSFNLIAGPPGVGKTTLVHQIVFANATVEKPAIYFTMLGEPSLKMLRYQQQMQYFDPEKIGAAVRYVDLSPDILRGDLDALLDRVTDEVEASKPAVVVIDSFRSMASIHMGTGNAQADLQRFMQRLALSLTSWHVTSFLLGEYGEKEMDESPNPVFTIADSILSLTRDKQRNSVVRKLEV